MAAGHHFKKHINRHNSAALQDTFTKFGTEIDTGQPRLPLTSNFTSKKFKMAAAVILGKQKWPSQPVCRSTCSLVHFLGQNPKITIEFVMGPFIPSFPPSLPSLHPPLIFPSLTFSKFSLLPSLPSPFRPLTHPSPSFPSPTLIAAKGSGSSLAPPSGARPPNGIW